MKKLMYAIVPAAGIGRRFDASRKKTFVDLNEVPLLIRTLLRLHTESAVSEIIPVVRDEDVDYVSELIRNYPLPKIKQAVQGGPERQDSVGNALAFLERERSESLADSLILIHDGVRPVFPEGTIEALMAALRAADGAVPGLRPSDTLKKVGKEGLVLSTINRDEIRAIQTPQLFPFPVIQKAYELTRRDGFYATDDAALVERMGGTVTVIPGSPSNIKITTPDDLEMVEYILKKAISGKR